MILVSTIFEIFDDCLQPVFAVVCELIICANKYDGQQENAEVIWGRIGNMSYSSAQYRNTYYVRFES